jgi:hypothetical protein
MRTGPQPALAQLAGWPSSYFDSSIDRGTEERPAADSVRRDVCQGVVIGFPADGVS